MNGKLAIPLQVLRCEEHNKSRNNFGLGNKLRLCEMWRRNNALYMPYALQVSLSSPRTRPELLANPETPFWQHALAAPPQCDNGVRHV